MKRLHLHVGVDNLQDAIRFYSALFGAEPVKTKDDYAKWMVDDPRINFAVSTRAKVRGVDHLGIQVESEAELAALRAQLKSADMAMNDEGDTVCCYARSDKSWVTDPAGIAWEAYHTMADAQMFSGSAADMSDAAGACCAPQLTKIGMPQKPSCGTGKTDSAA